MRCQSCSSLNVMRRVNHLVVLQDSNKVETNISARKTTYQSSSAKGTSLTRTRIFRSGVGFRRSFFAVFTYSSVASNMVSCLPAQSRKLGTPAHCGQHHIQQYERWERLCYSIIFRAPLLSWCDSEGNKSDEEEMIKILKHEDTGHNGEIKTKYVYENNS